MQEKSLNGLNLTSENKKSLDEYLRYIDKHKPSCVVLFGSVARDEDTDESDIDIAIITNNLPNDIFEKCALFKYPSIQPTVYDLEEFNQLLNNKNPIALEIVADGIPLIGESIYLKFYETFSQVIKRYGVQRVRGGWNF